MALRTARSTVDQRQALICLHDDLQEAVDSLPGRFWCTDDQRDAYNMVLRHLERWAGHEA